MNAELRRNAWLELRPAPCGVALALLALMVVPFLSRRAGTWQLDVDGVMILGLVVFLFYALWGLRKAGASVTDEVRAGTWDQQRLSAHDGLSLVLGKLFGATSFSWFGAAGGLLLYGGGQLWLMETGPAALHVSTLVSGAVACQALALVGSLHAASRLRATRRGRAGWLQAAGVILGLWVLLVVVVAAIKNLHLLLPGWSDVRLSWWVSMPVEAWAPLTLTAVAGWALVAAERLMRLELQLPTRPWSWLGFLVFSAVWLYPFAAAWLPGLRGPAGPLLALAAVAGIATYAGAVGERLDAVRLRTIAVLWRRPERGAWLGALPLWPLSLVLTCLCVTLLVAGAAAGYLVPGLADMGRGALPAATLATFLLRDTALVLATQLAMPRWRTPEGPVLVGALVLYALLPMILTALGRPVTAAIPLLLPSFRLLDGGDGWVGLLAALPGCVAALWLADRGVRRTLAGQANTPKA